ncbi:MAG: acyl-[acyl-carrier-protein]-phospholipid O-acyltransferase, partial [Candidatus Paceibacteria bacterium]
TRCFRGEERVGIFLPPGAGAVLAHLATIFAGKVPIHLNYSLGAKDLADPIKRAGLKHIITSPRFLKALDGDSPVSPEQAVMLESLAGELSSVDKLRALCLSLLPTWLLVRAVRPVIDPDATATILFSSGSTGKPKGVVLTHRNVLSNLDAFSEAVQLTEQDALLGVLPFFHSFGHTATLWAPLLRGSKAVYHARPTDGARIGELCAEEKVTIALATPTFYQAWMRRVPMESFESLRLAITGAEKLQSRFSSAFKDKYGLDLLEGYGCTELSPVVSVNLPDLEPVPHHESARREGTVGRPLPGISVRIVDPVSGLELAPGEEGSVMVSGPNVMHGYLDDPERTAEVLRDGWYDTGDVGVIDRDGFLTLTDRRSRFAKVGGEMVPQGRVESSLHCVCADLIQGAGMVSENSPEIAVTCVPDDRKGERLVVLHTSLPFEAEALCAALRAGDLPALYQPRADQYFLVAEIPKLGTGKTDLKALKDLALDLANPEPSSD